MLKLGVLVSGGGTNLQAIMDAIDSGVITNAEVGLVISNNPGAYALKRAESRGIPAKCISPKKFENREEFHKALLQELQENKVELVVLAGFLVAIPPMIVEAQQGDTPEVLQRRVMEEAEWKILPKAIDLIANNRVSVQNGKVVID